MSGLPIPTPSQEQHPFDRLPAEPHKAWECFCVYRDLGPERSVDQAYRNFTGRENGTSTRRWDEWSRVYRWVERARAYDDYLESRKRAAWEQKQIELAQRRAQFEFQTQEYIEELVGVLRAAVKKHENAPVSDVERKEDKEITVEAGKIKTLTTVTKVKAMKVSGLARLSDAYRDSMKQAVIGVRKETEDSAVAAVLEPKSVMPDWLAEAMLDAQQLAKAKTDEEPK